MAKCQQVKYWMDPLKINKETGPTFFFHLLKKKNKNKGKQVREEREVHKLENLICVPE